VIRDCATPVVLTNVTLWQSPLLVENSDVEAFNSILWMWTSPGDPISGDIGRFAASYCDINGGWPGTANIDADPLIASNRDARLRPDSPCVDMGSALAPELPGTDIDGQPRELPGRPGAPGRVDIGADEMRFEHAALFGSLGVPYYGLLPMLLVNGTDGGPGRVVDLPSGELRIEMREPVDGPTAPFVVYAWLGVPTIDTVREQPRGLGFTAFPTPLDGTAGARPVAIFNNLGYTDRLGEPTRPSEPAPSVLIDRKLYLPLGTTFTLQGFVSYEFSNADVPASVTNGVTVVIR